MSSLLDVPSDILLNFLLKEHSTSSYVALARTCKYFGDVARTYSKEYFDASRVIKMLLSPVNCQQSELKCVQVGGLQVKRWNFHVKHKVLKCLNVQVGIYELGTNGEIEYELAYFIFLDKTPSPVKFSPVPAKDESIMFAKSLVEYLTKTSS